MKSVRLDNGIEVGLPSGWNDGNGWWHFVSGYWISRSWLKRAGRVLESKTRRVPIRIRGAVSCGFVFLVKDPNEEGG